MADNISFSSDDDDDDDDDDYIGPSTSASASTSTTRPIDFLLSPHYTPMNHTRTSLGPSPKDITDALFLSKQKRATAVCFKRNDGTTSVVVHETTVFVEVDLLNGAVKSSLEGRSRIFQLGNDFDADKDVIKYEFEPTHLQNISKH
jgi:hypothetical protein